MSKNLRILGQYSARMTAGDYDAVYEVFAPDFISHVTSRVNPDAVGTDIRPQEQKFWESARAAFSDMQFNVDLLIEHGDLIVSNWTLSGTHDGAPYQRRGAPRSPARPPGRSSAPRPAPAGNAHGRAMGAADPRARERRRQDARPLADRACVRS